MKIESVGTYLTENGVKPSVQRIKIFEYLIAKRNHPTVDMIYKELIDDMPTLSKTTIYNTLKLFVEKGIVLIVNIEDNETRYDADTSLHGHFKCEKCETVYDFDVSESGINLKNIDKFKINETHIYIKGICEKCNK